MSSSTMPQSSSLQFGGTSNQLQYPGQQSQLGAQQLRPILHQPTSSSVSQQQKAPVQPTLRSQSTPNNIQVGYWPNTFKKSSQQNNVNSVFNNGLLSKQSFLDTAYNQVTL